MRIIDGSITAPKGFITSGIKCGIKTKTQAEDLALIYSESRADAAAVYTSNKVKAAPLLVTKKHLSDGKAQAVVINSGNANACTGKGGLRDAFEMTALTAQALKIPTGDVLVASTGVIGRRLPMEAIRSGIPIAVRELRIEGEDDAAHAIMTTDTAPKKIAVQIELSDSIVRIGGMTKGSGMIAPNMATMLAFLTTDVNVDSRVLQKLLKNAVDLSFNMITVDGDMSTNDNVIILANGLAGNRPLIEDTDDYNTFSQAINLLCIELAKMIVRDGEGATKFVTVSVKKAKSFKDAKRAAMAIANSSLVKTAIFGADPNWGRILAALGYSGTNIDEKKTSISINDLKLFSEGLPLAFDDRLARELLARTEIFIEADLQSGESEATVYTCDFSYDYVRINAEYTT